MDTLQPDGRRWFLSYHSPDQALAKAVKVAIEAKDLGARVFFAPSDLRAGGFWSRALADEIAQADAFVLLVGENGVGNWQVLEYDEALDKSVNSPGFRLVVLLLEGRQAPGLQFLRRLHWIVTTDPASERDVARLVDAAAGKGTTAPQLWRYTSPYRGLAAMEEKDSDYFFGRSSETLEVLNALAADKDRVPVLMGASGVGKSSLARAGVVAALKRQAWPDVADAPRAWPLAFRQSRRWCFLTLKPGSEPLRALVASFFDTWDLDLTDSASARKLNGWVEDLRVGSVAVRDLLQATEQRYRELGREVPPAFFLYVDQGEELYVRVEERERGRFSQLIAQSVVDPRVHIMMSMRSDFLEDLQRDEALLKVHRQINVPPPNEAHLREAVTRPAALLGVKFEKQLAEIIIRRTAEQSATAGALPLLSYTLEDMWKQMVERGDGVLRLAADSFELAGVLVNRGDSFLADHPGREAALRRVTLKLATVREGEDPTRRRALRSEFKDEEDWRLVSELADDPYRLLVTGQSPTGDVYAEIAHETLFRRWTKLSEWITAEREFLAWRSGLESVHRAWLNTPEESRKDALLMGVALVQAQSWLLKRGEDLSDAERDFIEQSAQRERKARRQSRRVRALVYGLSGAILVGLIGVIYQTYITDWVNWVWTVRPYQAANVDPYVLKLDDERALNPGASFIECVDNTQCPDMVVVPAGEFMMGSPESDTQSSATERDSSGGPHKVVIAQPFAVSRFELSFDNWDACVKFGSCSKSRAAGLGRGRSKQPVVDVDWYDAKEYVAWLSKMTRKPYRLLSEAEWEYATRAGKNKNERYFWGDVIPKGKANCIGCGSAYDYKRPVAQDEIEKASFEANGYGLYNMHGNVWEWVEDCYNKDYNGAPTDGSPWISGDCRQRIVRGGSYDSKPSELRSAHRAGITPDTRSGALGIRVARTLATK